MQTDAKLDIELLNPEMWQLEVLTLNPHVNKWGAFENYMKGNKGMAESRLYDSWHDFRNAFGLLDEYNQVVNFYFEVDREKIKCEHCENGDHIEITSQVDAAKFNFEKLAITQPELAVFVRNGVIKSKSHGRVFQFATGWFAYPDGQEAFLGTNEQVVIELPPLNEVNRDLNEPDDKKKKWITGFDKIGHREILLVRRTLEDLPTKCSHCEGKGFQYTSECTLRLNLWMIHPGYGASRGIKIKSIKKEELREVFEYLKTAQEILEKKFRRITEDVEVKLGYIESVRGSWKDHFEQASDQGPLHP